MKRIALIIALALVISVGGVYATWVYSDLAVQSRNVNIDTALSITGAQSDTTKGIIAITDELVLTIDDDDAQGTRDHKPNWSNSVQNPGQVKITFTPNTGASTTSFRYYITIGNVSYTCPDEHNVTIFNVTNADDKLAGVEGIQIISGTFEYEGGSNAPVVVTITAAQLQTALKLNTDVLLDTFEEYNAYSEHLNQNVALTLHVEEVE